MVPWPAAAGGGLRPLLLGQGGAVSALEDERYDIDAIMVEVFGPELKSEEEVAREEKRRRHRAVRREPSFYAKWWLDRYTLEEIHELGMWI